MAEEARQETRVRMNVTQSAKGIAQVDVTAEAPSDEQARDLFKRAIEAAKEEVKGAGFKLANEIA